MPSYKTAFGDYLKQEDLQGKTARVVIEHVGPEEIRDGNTNGTEQKLIAHFVGKDKTLILNRTNCESLEAICGTDDYAAWRGHAVVLYVDPNVKFGSKIVGGLRIRASQPMATPHVMLPPPMPRPPPFGHTDDDDSIPF